MRAAHGYTLGCAVGWLAVGMVTLACEGGELAPGGQYDVVLVDTGDPLDVLGTDDVVTRADTSSATDILGETPGPGAREDTALATDSARADEDGTSVDDIGEDDISALCDSNASCPQDDNPCTVAVCSDSGTCNSEYVEGPCSDDDECTSGDSCQQGVCQPGSAVECEDDGNPCTTEICQSTLGCQSVPNAEPCTDDNPCTVNDQCAGGECVSGSLLDCGDTATCIAGACQAINIPAIVLNEIDHWQGEETTSDFIELQNVGSEVLELGPVFLDVIAGNDGQLVTSIALGPAGSLDPGAHLLLVDQTALDAVDGTAATLVINESLPDDVFALRLRTGDVFIDGIAVGGSVTGVDVGAPLSVDPGPGGWSRCISTDDDGTVSTTWSHSPLTPGIGNVCDVPACTTNESCSNLDTSCLSASCDVTSGLCLTTSVSGPCDDGDVCTPNDECLDGVCTPGDTIQCEDDGNPCTSATCLPLQGCVTENTDSACDDGDLCTADGICVNGQCEPGTAVICSDDGNVCTTETCVPLEGCKSFPNDVACSDGDECTVDDVCVDSSCQSGALLECPSDGNECTISECLAGQGCTAVPKAGPCSDDNVCTTGDTCVQGTCVGNDTVSCPDDGNPCTTESCDSANGCQSTNNTLPCSDGNACTEGEICANGACSPGEVIDCVQDNNPCTVSVCNPEAGCAPQNNDSAACNDGNACTIDVCFGGVCDSSVTLSCEDDGNPCTTEFCDPENGCQVTLNSESCDDGNACTDGDACSAGSCIPGTQVVCVDDGNPCTTVACIPETGCVITNVDADCSDENECTSNDACVNGTCTGGGVVVCEQDNNPCTQAQCDPVDGCQDVAVNSPCDDGDACTVGDTCTEGSCTATPVTCALGKVCLNGTCVDENTGKLVFSELDYNQPGADNSDFVEILNLGPAPQGLDGVSLQFINGANNEAYQVVDLTGQPALQVGQRLVVGTQTVLDTIGSISPTVLLGTVIQNGPDGINLRVQGQIVDSLAYGGTGFPAGEGTSAVTDSGEGSLSRCPDEVDTDDNFADFRLRTATPGEPNNCGCFSDSDCAADQTACTATTCNVVSGECETAFTTVACDDGDACTTDDMCSQGQCQSGTPLVCGDDGNPCTEADCDPQQGCFTVNVDGPCDDGDACTAGDDCVAGACIAGDPVICVQDTNPCTAEQCDSNAGCQTINISGACDDGDACTVGEGCAFGNCLGGTPVTCTDDGNPCTDAICQSETGCIVVSNTASCDDGDPCTTDSCVDGSCESIPVFCAAGTVCEDGECVAPPLDCPAYAVCVEACDATDIPCIAACGSASEPSVVTAYDELSECLTLVCPTAESGCVEAAIQETGSCFSQHVTCYGCDPLCGAKECGSDGCGGSCGACDTGTYCSLDGLCVDITLEKLVINEVDYDQPGPDDNEFVELLNVGDAPVALINYRLEFVNGANGSVYQNLELGTAPNPVLQPGEYLLVATQPLADNVILISWSIQNGASDGIRLMGIAGNVKDSVSYGGVLSGVTEGLGGAPEDTGVVIGEGISRCVDGIDTEQNSSDFKVTSITPGGPNFCPVCNPSCDGKTCGDDGCGGTCGECAEDSICLPSGTCFSQPVLCADSVSCAKQCVDTGGQVTPCLDSCAPEDNAALDAFITWRQCIEPICSVATSSSCFDATSCSSLLEACVNPCTAVCEGKACGDDGCGGSCGTCDSGEQCTQDGQCDIVTCSNDTSCPAGSQCDLASGICVCAPQCTGKTCGDDGCGGTCGVCPLGSFCLEDGTCELLDCASDSQCPIGSNCIGGQCVCSPSCAPGQQCGGDGCGGQCGQCPNGSICSSTGACIAQPADCSSAFFCTLDCLAIANGDTSSCYDQCQPLTGQSDYMLWFNCIEPACQNAPNDLACISVEPSCADLEALCTSPPCTPNCAGKVCGDDGCGGLCGDCAPGTICSADGSVCDGAGPGLIINEFDYALPGLDEGEFIEIYNIGSDPADLINATLELIDGLTGFAYQTISLTVSPNLVLQPGEYLTLSNAPISGLQTVVTAFELQDSIPSGLALYVGGQLVDFVSYGGTIAGFDQMTGFAPVDDASAPGLGLSRCPNGQDSNDGFIDFILAPTSPTTANTCQICAPNCDGKNCGDDGCGGQCGVCDPEFECNSQGQCSAVLYNCSDSYACLTECLANSEYAVCAGQCTPSLAEQQLLYQEVLSCVAPGCSIPGAGAECLDTPECSGVVSLCVSSQCQPDCAGKVCGDDGCGGSCGTCTLGSQCLPAGTCEAIGCQSDIDCPVGAGCNLATATCGCVPQCSGKQCGDDGCGGSCGECPNGGLCSVDGLCPQPIDCADGLACLENCIGSGTDIFGCYDTCVPSDANAAIDFQNVYFCAFSDCSGTTDPSCLQQTPACKANYDICKVTCEPACGGKSCGQDGCGGSCGDCDAGDTCDLAGSCVPKATSCAGAQDCYSACLFHTADVTACVLTCEPSSGTAEAISNFFNWTNCIQPLCFGLNGDPQCVNIDPACDDLAAICASDGCTPECSGKQCGGDGCGGSCGSCGIGDECGQTGLCQDIVCTDDSNCPVDTGCIGGTCECVPQCTGKQCGGDGCGGLCGTCGAGESCFADGGCYGSSTTCADGAACFAACVGSNEAPFDCLNTCGPPPDTPARDLFNEWFVCVYPNCDLNPGDATCVDIPECGPALDACQNVVCVPECALKECGDDGCGTSCGLCDSGQVCSAKGVCELDQARLVINEVDHVQSNGTASDFIELLNAGTQPVALLDLFVDISSAESAITQTVALPDAVLLPGGYLIIAQSEAVNQAPSGVLVFELAQAFPDGALGVVLRQSDGTPLDSVSIGASAPSIGEGPKAPADGGLDGVSRCPDGIDSDDNSQDFLVVPVSPGSINACPVCNPQCGSSFCGPDGCGGLCGVCGDGETCADGQCVAVGCTGQGDCPQGTVCNLATGQCECAPDCTGKNCGSDGCSGVCGTCGVEQECSIEGICVSPIPLGLKVNEVDCIQASDDLLEFVEIYNSSDVSVPLAGKVLELLGADGTAYHVVNLSLAGPELLPGQYLVVGDNELIATITATIPLINEEWDILDADGGVRLLDNGEIIDALAYGTVSAGIGEGSSALPPGENTSLQRCSSGVDTDDNLADFSALIATPAAGCF